MVLKNNGSRKIRLKFEYSQLIQETDTDRTIMKSIRLAKDEYKKTDLKLYRMKVNKNKKKRRKNDHLFVLCFF